MLTDTAITQSVSQPLSSPSEASGLIASCVSPLLRHARALRTPRLSRLCAFRLPSAATRPPLLQWRNRKLNARGPLYRCVRRGQSPAGEPRASSPATDLAAKLLTREVHDSPLAVSPYVSAAAPSSFTSVAALVLPSCLLLAAQTWHFV